MPGNRHDRLFAGLTFRELRYARVTRLNKSNYGPFAAERLVCRMMTSAGPQQAAMIQKWVEWRYGKPKEHLEHRGSAGAPIQIISYVPRPGDDEVASEQQTNGSVTGNGREPL